jgi:DNA-directed RNA polymerase beta subunit
MQKGTCGILMSSIDMPFTKHGIRPDIILNPNAIPSRQTIGQLLESLVGKVAALDVMEGDGTPFEDFDIEKVEKRLEALGYDPKGYEEMYNGMTGEWFDVEIFITPCYYQRLQKFAVDEVYSISTGPTCAITHQPLEGRILAQVFLEIRMLVCILISNFGNQYDLSIHAKSQKCGKIQQSFNYRGIVETQYAAVGETHGW